MEDQPGDTAMEVSGHSHDMTETVAANSNNPPSVLLHATPNSSGIEVHLSLSNFELSSKNVDQAHIDGQGHAHLYLDGVKVTRLFDNTYQLDNVATGSHTVSVELVSNDHRVYSIAGHSIEAIAEVTVGPIASQFAVTAGLISTTLEGVDAGDQLGTAVRGAGDFNGDGIDDVIIAAPMASNSGNTNDGEVFIVFGSASGLPSTFDLTTLNGINGFKIVGANSGDLAGASVGGGGDLNNDGFDDVVIGAPEADSLNRVDSGAAFVLLGSNSFGAAFNLANLNGANGFRINGAVAGDDAGRAVAISSDVNGDAFDEVIVGAPLSDSGGADAGAAYVIFGRAANFPASIDLNSVSSAQAIRINGTTGENLGFSVDTAGDVNSDGLNDIVIGAPTGLGGGVSTSCDSANTVGLIQCDAAAAPGYTLFAPNPSTETFLVDQNGFLVNSWTASNRPGLSAVLLDDGSLLRTANTGGTNFVAGGNGGAVEIYDWEGNRTWQYTYSNAQHRLHHDVEMLPNGNVLMIAWELKSQAEAITAGRDPSLLTDARLWPDTIIEVQPTGATTGDIVWQWNAWDHLVQDFDATKANFGSVASNPQLIDLNFTSNGGEDWLHFNSIDYNPALDQILISVHGFSEIWVIDHSTTTQQAASHSGGDSGKGGDLLYRWGNAEAYQRGTTADREFYTQHDAQWIEPGLPGAGNILVFNNGQRRPGGNASSVEELTPPVDANGNYTLNGTTAYGPTSAVWTWTDTPATDFYAQNISGAHRLANGNTLITNGPEGRFLEVDAAGAEVFEYINPVTNSGPLAQGTTPAQNAVFRATKYDPSFAGFSGRDLSPGGTVETGGGTATEISVQEGSAYVVFGSTAIGSSGVSSLNGSSGFKISGAGLGDQTGYSVGTAGDVNGDGFDDVVVGSPRAKVDGVSVGAAYVVLGRASGFSSNILLNSLTAATGYRLANDYQSDPLLNSLIVNATGQTGHNGAIVNFDSVILDKDYVHVHTSGIPHYSIGPWGPNPNDATDQDVTFYIPRDPVVNEGTKTRTRLGAIGTWIDGTAIFNWSDGRTFQNAGVWNRLAVVFEAVSFDACDAHPPATGQYHTHGVPTCLVNELDDDGSEHSPILGWSFDGFPIYGSYGYVDGNSNAGIERIESSWQLRNITSRTDGPPLAAQPLGSFLEDFEYVAGSGDLDQYNGRFSPTPDYPDGIYHYYVTIDASGEPAFPYSIGLEYNGVVAPGNANNGGTAPALGSAEIAVGTGGDRNNDGFDDVIVGDPNAYVSGVGVAGSVFVAHGGPNNPADVHLHAIDGSNGIRLDGSAAGDRAGVSVDFAGDVNGDGSDDLIAGAPGNDSGGMNSGEAFIVVGDVLPASVVGRGVAYAGASASYGEHANDPNKSALRVPGTTATAANFTNYTKGLNRVLVDIANLPLGNLDSDGDFDFRVGNSPDPSTWTLLSGTALPTVSSAVDFGGGVSRVTLTWADAFAIKNSWLQVTVNANGNTGLLQDDVFYFGNQVGDVDGSTSSSGRVTVNAFDTLDIRFNQSPSAGSVDMSHAKYVYDIDRSGSVNAFDTLDARFNQVPSGGLMMITLPSSPPPAALAAFAARQNPNDRLDVNADGKVTSLDALLGINLLEMKGMPSAQSGSPLYFYDVNGDGRTTAMDTLQIINALSFASYPESQLVIPQQVSLLEREDQFDWISDKSREAENAFDLVVKDWDSVDSDDLAVLNF
ncbi:YHYH protein [Rubripirellula tenax]|nr:YHYH protein [Rubripirellula tenax]